MSETAAELATRVVPEVPVRQRVLSLPWALRLPVARDSALLGKVARIFFEAIRDHLRAGDAQGRGLARHRAHRARCARLAPRQPLLRCSIGDADLRLW